MPAEFTGDPYGILGVPRDASPPDVKEAYRRLAKATHPDVDARPEAEAQMVRINQAYELLADPLRRGRWDALHPVIKPARPGSPSPTGSSGPASKRPPAYQTQPPRGPSAARSTVRPSQPPPPPPPSRRTFGNPYPNPPTLDEAYAFRVGFGKYRGQTLREVAIADRGYLDWIVRSVHDRPRLVACTGMVIRHLEDLDRAAQGRPPSTASGAPPTRPGMSKTALAASSAIERLRERIRRERVVMIGVAAVAALITFLFAVMLILAINS